jgi:hypothetical protein
LFSASSLILLLIIFRHQEGFGDEAMVAARRELAQAKRELELLLKRTQEKVHQKAAYKISGPDYLFELPTAGLKEDKIPSDWREEKGSAKTKKRFGR